VKRYSSPSWVKFTSSCNVELQKALKSSSEFGSVAMTSSIFPDDRRFSDFFVFRMGSGQFNPLASSTSSAISVLSLLSGFLACKANAHLGRQFA
jgi:hypothetical protein